jgi:hypothetical protein
MKGRREAELTGEASGGWKLGYSSSYRRALLVCLSRHVMNETICEDSVV